MTPGSSRQWRALAGLFYWLFVAYLALPLGLIALLSLKQAPLVGFPVGTPTAHWYAVLLSDGAMLRAFAYSLLVAIASTTVAVVAGVWTALAIAHLRRVWLRAALLGGAMVPLVTPGIVHAIALRMAIRVVSLDPGPLAVMLGHAIHAAPYVVLLVTARLGMMPPRLIEAARDLGAGAGVCFWLVTLPWLRPAIAGGALLAALSSFGDFLRSFFLSGYQATLPMLIYGRIRSGLTPEINAAATLVLLVTAFCGLAAERQTRRARRR